ncbi:MAG: precorrin-3B synthase [Scytolyngbya sp. HA4215-MV1]|nr:precorrin-3B synthase [Scytolyngbya sp. HA4215-MV1]
MNWLTEANVCPGLFYGTPARDGFLIRIRTPGGWLNPQQARHIATLAEQWGCETIQVTNRANLQIRSVQTSPTLEAFQALQQVGLAAQNPEVDHLRNLMSSPTAGIDPQEWIDTRPLVQALDTYIQHHAELAQLPAKLSIGIDGGGAVGIGTRAPLAWEHRYNEIQLSAVLANVPENRQQRTPREKVYFRLALGGDKQLWDTPILIAPDECVSIVAVLMRVYLDYVCSHPTAAKKPRMKHLLQEWGLETYLDRVSDRLEQPLRRVTEVRKPLPTQPYGHLGVHPQRQTGLSYIGTGVRLGQLTIAQLLGLAQLAETVEPGQICLTPWQTVLLPNIPNEQVSDQLQKLASLGLPISVNRVDAAIVACAGKPGCAAAVTQTQPHALALADYLTRQVTLDRPVNIHLTGCPKSCAQPSPAEITLLGTTIERPNEMIEGYHIYLGTHSQSSLPQFHSIPAADVPSLIEQLLNQYKNYRYSSDESLDEFINRNSIKQ